MKKNVFLPSSYIFVDVIQGGKTEKVNTHKGQCDVFILGTVSINSSGSTFCLRKDEIDMREEKRHTRLGLAETMEEKRTKKRREAIILFFD